MSPIPAFALPDPATFPGLDAPQDGVAPLRRPRLLMSAARHGLAEYRRTRDLTRLLGHCPDAASAVAELADMEAEAEAARRAGSPAWSCIRHVEVLIALMSERALSAR